MDVNDKKMTTCKSCGQPIAKSAKSCPNCGAKNKKPFYKRVWFILLCVFLVLGLISSLGGEASKNNTDKANSSNTSSNTSSTPATSEQSPVEEIAYTQYSISEMMDDLENNALKAESKYNKQYVEITGKLNVIDSSGKYISLVRTDNQFAILGVQCYLKNDDQKQQVMEMSIGDTITLRGKITNVGEVMGYSLDISEIVN